MPKPTSLMTQYKEGQLVTAELQRMMADYAAEVNFDLYMHDDIDIYADRQAAAGKLRFTGDGDPEYNDLHHGKD